MWEAECKQRRGRQRDTQNPKRGPGSELSAQSLMRGSNSQTVRSWPGPKSDAQPTEPPRSPMRHVEAFLSSLASSTPTWFTYLPLRLRPAFEVKPFHCPRHFMIMQQTVHFCSCNILGSGLITSKKTNVFWVVLCDERIMPACDFICSYNDLSPPKLIEGCKGYCSILATYL